MTAPDPKLTELPTSYASACSQVNEAQQDLNQDYSTLAPLPWAGLHDLVGPPLPRDLWVVGARSGNGKSTFMMALFDQLVSTGWRTMYIGAGAEGPPKDLRQQWAALRLGYPVDRVLEKRWDLLPDGAKDKVWMELQNQSLKHHEVAQFADCGEQLTVDSLRAALKVAKQQECQYVLLDHIHRIRFDANHKQQEALKGVTEGLRNTAAKYDWSVLLAAQLKRSGDTGPLRDLVPPVDSDLAECGTLERDAVVVLLLHRTRRAGVTAKEVSAVVKGERPVSDIIAPNTMAVKVGKHRRRGRVKDYSAFLQVTSTGRLLDQSAPWKEPPEPREPGEDLLPF